jgi:hypothetical protein
MVTVDVEQASSVTTINPLGRVLTDALLALPACGDNDGRLMCYEKKTKETENNKKKKYCIMREVRITDVQ